MKYDEYCELANQVERALDHPMLRDMQQQEKALEFHNAAAACLPPGWNHNAEDGMDAAFHAAMQRHIERADPAAVDQLQNVAGSIIQ